MFLLGLLIGAVLSGVAFYEVGYVRGEEKGFEDGILEGSDDA